MKKIFLSYPYSEEDTELIGKFKKSFGDTIIYDELTELTREEAEELNSDTLFRYREPSVVEVRKRIEVEINDSDEVIIIITKRFKYDSYGQFAFKTSPIVEYVISQARKQDKHTVCFYEEEVPIESLFPQLKTKISFNRRDVLEKGEKKND